ncbi:hypothetical protein GCM10017566_07990 [Amycolatopsis bartoniae]|uniref:Uncharacterized protein n=1 Tax=Amycolatopsis bartoniae TaxID=941986 RepID=A0A8H9IRK5_9PSEU|nr:hypothetical protein GCM10017566_07990 [Amycolatopsis bartoniae]
MCPVAVEGQLAIDRYARIGSSRRDDHRVDQNKQDSWWGVWGQWVGAVSSIAAAAVAVAIAYLGWKKSDEHAAKRS